MKLLEYLNSPYYHEGKLFAKVRQFCWCDLKVCTALIITIWNFLKNMADFMKSLENLQCPYLSIGKIPKMKQFVDATSKFNMPLLSRTGIFAKNKVVLMVPIEKFNLPLTTWSVHKNKIIPIHLLENSTCRYITDGIFSKINQFCWSALKIWTAPIIMSWNFRRNKAVFSL